MLPPPDPPAAPELQGQRVRLRPLRPGDAGARRACGYQAEFERLLGHDAPASPSMSAEQAAGWYESREQQPVCWAIEVAGRCVGTVGFVGLHRRSQWAIFSLELFDPTVWNQGLGTEATRRALRYAFEDLGLHRVSLQVLAYNARAIRVYEKCGFRREGLERECRRVDGEWQSDLRMGLLDREYRDASARW